MAGILEIIDSLKQVANRWVNTSVLITSDISVGDTILEVRNSKRFLAGDEVMIRGTITGDANFYYISSIMDDTHVELTSPVIIGWDISQGVFLQKVYNGQMLNGIYMGEPDNIPGFPAITVKASSAGSEWLTIDSTKETYQLEMTIYNKSSAQESGYKANIRLAETLKYGLKKNLYLLIHPYNSTTIKADILTDDIFIKVNDTSILHEGGRIIIEGEYNMCETFVSRIIDSETIRISPAAGSEFYVSENTAIIAPERFIFNSWPENITYGEIFKGTLLKASKISWFAWEEIIWQVPPAEQSLH